MHPLVVISYNNHVYVEGTIAFAEKYGLRPIVLDNASTYERTRDYLKSIDQTIEVIHLPSNFGFMGWLWAEFYDRLPTRFFLTDPDLAWNANLPADFPSKLDDLCSEFNARKVGFALDLSDSSTMFQDADYHQGRSIFDWESQFWAKRIEHPSHVVYDAILDTTFQLFDKTNTHGVQLRVAGDFTAKHLPWYRETTISSHDLVHMYVESQASTIARLVLREMARKNTLTAAFDECRRTCSSPLKG